jgi:hypothetical protein
MSITIEPRAMDSSSIFSPKSFLTASIMIQTAARKIRSDSITPEIFSILPCPYGCRKSGGLSETLTEKNEIIAAIRSIKEWIASDKMLTDPLISPTANFIKISRELEIIERRAILTLAFMKATGISGLFFTQ